MKTFLLSFLLSISLSAAFGAHITGGEVIYDYIGPGNNGARVYRITLLLFRDELAPNAAAMPSTVALGIFNNDNGFRIGPYRQVQRSTLGSVGILTSPNCLTNAPNLSYSVGNFSFEIELPANTNGYTVTYQTCCRVAGITNGGASEAATYTTSIPGSQTLPQALSDNSARFETGISIICYNKPFTLDFSATDSDGDSLFYRFDRAYAAHAAVMNATFAAPIGPPYPSISYNGIPNPFSAQDPFGTGATINPATGIISGIAPDAGKYVICVTVESYRNGQYIGEHRKDFIVTVAECDFASATLQPVYTFCDAANGFVTSFRNLNNSPLNLTFDWEFGDGGTSQDEEPVHTYAAAGTYTLKLVVNRGTPCADSMNSQVRVYPGFFPAVGPVPTTCKDIPLQFNDATTATYGTPSYWHWNFGDPASEADTARIRNPVYAYPAAGVYTVEFIVETSVGCRDTLYPEITVVEKPDLRITNDTLICVVDTLQLNAVVTAVIGGTVTWSPNYMISDVNSFNPLVSPDVTTTYTAFFTDPYGCNTSKTVTVNVVNAALVTAANDTTICFPDQLTLGIRSTNTLYFEWSSVPATTIADPTARNPVVSPPQGTTLYHVKAKISEKCFAEDDISVKAVPYPSVTVSGDDRICLGDSAQLNASGGSSYSWTPTIYLNNPNIANPISQNPRVSLTYTVTVRDTLGCSKPVSQTFTINVIRVIADAGPQDTSVVLDQPLQLMATGSTFYEWSPPTWLSATNVANPISLPRDNITYTVKVTNDIGCFSRDTINVKVYFIPPDVYVPSAFTPSGDGMNDLFRPVALGIKKINWFRVFNRWGQLVYQTSQIGAGWNGKFNGQLQNPGAYVWEVEAVDYRDKTLRRKGSVILIN